MRTTLFFSIISLMYFQCVAQSFSDLSKNWLDNHVHTVHSGSDGFEDLQFLKKELEGKRIVALGEQTHGDGATFEARARLVKFLMEEMNFDVVIFEAGRFDLKVANDSMQASKDIDALKRSMYGFWRTPESEALYTYLQERLETNRFFEVGGFDSKHTSTYGFTYYSKALEEAVRETSEKIVATKNFKDYMSIWKAIEEEAASSMMGRIRFKMIPKEKQSFTKLSKWLADNLSEKGNKEWASQIRVIDESVLAYSDLRLLKLIFNKKSLFPINNRRDELMAENLSYLLNDKYKNRKVILIGASYHFIRNNHKIDPISIQGLPIEKSIIMGDLIYPNFKNEIYTIAFTAFEGSYGMVKNGKRGSRVVTPPQNSISYQLANVGYEQALVALSNTSGEAFWENPVVIRIADYESNISSKEWQNITDAVYFVKTMKPITQ